MAVLGWEVADKVFGPADPLEKTVKIGTLHFRVVGVSEKKGSAFGNSQDNFAVIPFSIFRKLFGSRPFGMQLLVKPKTPELVKVAMDDATVALRIERRLRPSEPDNFGMFTSDTFLEIYQHRDQRHLRGAGRRGGDVAGGRRDRHHEHHADGGQRADP